MLTYQDVITIRLAPLTTAAVSWDQMADGFEDLGDVYERSVQGVASDGEWVGLSAEAAKKRFTATREQFDAAAVEARAIASILRDIHAQFTERIQAVRHLVESAKQADMHIDAKGQAHLDTSKSKGTESGGVLGDATARALHEASWTAAVASAVQAVDDADQGAKLALRDAAGIKSFFEEALDTARGTAHDFNASALGDIEAVEAREANKYADQILAGEKPSDPEEWARLMRDNSGDKQFSQTVLNHVGPEGTIKMTNQLNTFAYDTDTGNKQHYLGAERGLANALATAVQDPKSQFYKDFHAGMKEAGMKRYEWQGEKVRGYQSLVTLMQHGDGYPDRFLHDLGDDLIAAEKADKGDDNWDLPKGFVASRDEWFANDPLDGLLGIMSKDPEASAAFLDPQSDPDPDDGRNEGNDRLEYLTRQRDWEVVDGHPTMRNLHDPDSMWGDPLRHSDIKDAQTRAGFGAALVAATTGIDPNNSGSGYVQHSDANNRVFENALKHLSAEGDDFPPSLRTPMAVVMGNYGDEVHATTSALNDSSSPLDRREVLEVSKQISRDRFAYFTLQDSINREIVHDINMEGDPEEMLRRAGHTIGFLEEVRYQGLAMDADNAKSKAAWDAKMDYHTWGGVVNFIPYVGDATQRGVDVLTSQWLENETKRIDDGLARDNRESSTDLESRVSALAGVWREANPAQKDTESEYTTASKLNELVNDGNRTARRLADKGS
ncbi:hypothetical protein [Streptomyces sp. Amel2xC10]|uniref:PPE domain-containing protein n=1 Tax=Streptomyces sp. Amel2xC10 TaxID=1305826 RepID=UPI000A08CC8D|nr:hypothetical protein [Streptomyces sp. Amel2xC10]SMF85646.1 hypothetical protein SAMN02745830_07009 [Streptomyces sp. Amel2xC10]